MRVRTSPVHSDNGAGPRLPTKYKPKRIVISDSEDSDKEKVLSAHKRYLRFIIIEMIIFYYCVDFLILTKPRQHKPNS